MASLIFIILRCVLHVFPQPVLLVIICIFQVGFFCTNPTHPTFCKCEDYVDKDEFSEAAGFRGQQLLFLEN